MFYQKSENYFVRCLLKCTWIEDVLSKLKKTIYKCLCAFSIIKCIWIDELLSKLNKTIVYKCLCVFIVLELKCTWIEYVLPKLKKTIYKCMCAFSVLECHGLKLFYQILGKLFISVSVPSLC